MAGLEQRLSARLIRDGTGWTSRKVRDFPPRPLLGGESGAVRSRINPRPLEFHQSGEKPTLRGRVC
jgi:hypothetical protein